MGAGRYVHLDVEEIVAATDMALLCVIDGEEVWIPRSQVADGGDYSEGDSDLTLSVTRWFADKEDLG
jgi:hypothetical protein